MKNVGAFTGWGLICIWCFLAPGLGRASNVIPWADSFESYPNSTVINGVNGWSARPASGGVVTNAISVTGALTNPPSTYPLTSATHTNVLQVAGQVSNSVQSVSGGIVILDQMQWPVWSEVEPVVDPDVQFAFCVWTNGQLMIWHHNTVASPATNEWRVLSGSPWIGTNAWTRFTVVQDYSNSMFQIRVNQAVPVTDSAGWSAPHGVAGGSWFNMVQTNGSMAGFDMVGVGGYLEDIVVTNRSLAWSGNGFIESPLNNGTISNAPIILTLSLDTFAGLADEDLAASGKVMVSGLPSNLTAVVHRDSGTQVSVSITNAALDHEQANSLSNLVIRFLDSAFTLGSAMSVVGAQQTNSITFQDTPSLAYSKTQFNETVTNNGSIDNQSPLLITLSHGAYSGSIGDDFGGASNKLQVQNLPAGVSVEALLQSPTQLQVRLLGQAVSHNVANNQTNVVWAFQDGAFSNVPASSVFYSTATLSVSFIDPSTLSYGTTAFVERVANDGVVTGSALITLQNKSFAATQGEDLVASLKVTSPNLPAGLQLQVVRGADPQQATLSFGGAATSHGLANSLSNLTVIFPDAAFVGANAAGVAGASRADLVLQFLDPAALNFTSTTFAEAGANDGSIGNSIAITLANASFAAGPFVQGTDYTVANVPGGLGVSVTRDTATQLTVSLTGAATLHAASNTIHNLQLDFADTVFAGVAASRVVGRPATFTVSFNDQPVLVYSSNVFHEQSGGVINNQNPVVITLSGDTFAGVAGQDFLTAGWLTTNNIPAGLVPQVTRASDTTLLVRFAGVALSNAVVNSVSNVVLTFQNGAFQQASAAQVTGRQKTDLIIQFIDDTGFYNILPYEEPFETYANGTAIGSVLGWVAPTNAGMVTNDAAVAVSEALYLREHAQFPVATTHAKTLYVRDILQYPIHSESNQLVFTDFMTVPSPMMDTPVLDDTPQCAFYVNTNRQLVVWHQDRSGGVTNNAWLILTGAGLMDTSKWTRFTLSQDYQRNMFQLQVNENAPITDPAGWTASGLSTGSWFYMAQTNGSMSGFGMVSFSPTYLDDLTVRSRLPDMYGQSFGSVFKIR